MKPTYITPMFKQYTRQIRSERYPVLNMIFGKILETGDIGIPVSRDWCINDQQRANEYLSSHSLETALNDPCLKREVLLLKANGLKLYRYANTGRRFPDLCERFCREVPFS